MSQDVRVELYYDGSWHDLTADELVRTSTTVSCSTGYADATNAPSPGQAKCTLDNANGLQSPVYPLSPFYGAVGRNTPMRLTVDGDILWTGEAAEWQPWFTLVSEDAGVDMTGAGIMRRLQQGSQKVFCALASTLMAVGVTPPAAYWPMDDGTDAESIVSPIEGVPPIPAGPKGLPELSTIDGPDGAPNKLPNLTRDYVGSAAALRLYRGLGPLGIDSTEWSIEFVAKIDTNGLSNNSIVTPINMWWRGTYQWSFYIRHRYNQFSGLGYDQFGYGSYVYNEKTATTILDIDETTQEAGVPGWHHYRTTFTQTGTAPNITLTITNYVDGVEFSTDSTTISEELPAPESIDINSQSSVSSKSTGFGHVIIWSGTPMDVGDAAWAFAGYPAEAVSSRFTRFCDERGISGAVLYGSAGSAAMGPQPQGTVMDVVSDVVSTDAGMLLEARSEAGLDLRLGRSLYSQEPALSIDWVDGVAPGLQISLGDRDLRNDITAKRAMGSSARWEITEGASSVGDPPDGVGRYAVDIQVNPWTDAQLIQHAHWLGNVLSCDEPRFSEIVLDLTANPALEAATADLGCGDLIEITNIPPKVLPFDLRAIVRGISRSMGPARSTITLLTIPASPYDVGEYDSTSSRYDSATSTLDSGIGSTDTSMDVAFTGSRWVRPEDTADAFPFQVVVDGEPISVVDVDGTTSPQTFTITRGVLARPHAAGASVRIVRPVRYGLGG